MQAQTQKLSRIILSLTFSLLLFSNLHSQVFVRANATGANDGSSWANAYTNLNTALENAAAGEIWVARGTYKPTTCNPCMEADMQAAFLIPPNVQLYGGFAGNEASRSQRDFQSNPTILSGDIGVVDDSTDNSYNVVIAENSTSTTVLDGFVIEDGNADGGFGFSFGGGLLIDAGDAGSGDIQVRNCTFRENYAGGGGGLAIDCTLGGASSALFRNCLFEGNTASLRVVSFGAGALMIGNSGAQLRPRFVSCTFQNNYSGGSGGGVAASPTGVGSLLAFEIDSCLFIDNRADNRGAGILYRMASGGESRVVIKNSRLIGNTSKGQGAALYARSSFDNVANDTLANCLFVRNTTDGSNNINDGEGGAVFLRGSQNATRNHTIINCVFDRNHANERGGALASTSFVSGAGSCNASLINCTFFGNTTNGEGGAIHVEGMEGANTIAVTNSILWRDSMGLVGNEIFNNGGSVSISYSDIGGGIPVGVMDGGNNFDIGPEFAGPENGDFHLTACSPLLDAGDNTAVPPLADPDPDGDPRIHNGIVDLGAYEVGIIYVDKTATGGNTGKSWADAFTDLQEGIAAAYPGDQIWVAQSTYFPVSCLPCSEEEKKTAFRIKSGVEMYGGFAGTETALAQRDWEANPTILSGDIGALSDSTDNVFSVIIAENTSSKTILDGFIIEEGNADGGFGLSFGGGLLIDAGNAGIGDIQVRNCTFRENYAGGGGGLAIDCTLGGTSDALFRNCLFEGNTASLRVVSFGAGALMIGNSGAQLRPRFVSCTFQNNYSGGSGGGFAASPTGAGSLLAFEVDSCLFIDNRADNRGAGILYRMASDGESQVVIKNSRFINNRSKGQGAALFARSSFDNVANDTLANCLFVRNTTDGTNNINDGEGGAVFLRGSQNATRNHTVINCVFAENSATERGGAIGTTSFVAGGGSLNASIINCTFYKNATQGEGGAIHTEGSEGVNTTTVVNSIFWEDLAEGTGNIFFNNGAALAVSYSDVQSGIPVGITDGGNNFSAGPQFLDPENGDFRISACSPARDAGLNTAVPLDLPDLDADSITTEAIGIDLRGENRFFNDTIDLGAYEWNEDPPELSLDITSANVSCNGLDDGKAEVNASGGVPGYTFAWSDGQTAATATGLSAGTYYLTVSDGFNCILTDSVLISENEPLLLSVSNDTTICAGEPAGLSASATGGNGNYIFEWDNGLENGPDQQATPSTTTDYTVTVSDSHECIAEASVRITVNELPDASITGNLSFCTDSATVLDAGAFANYLWSTGDTSRTLLVSQANEYSLTVTDTNGCTGTAEVSVEESEALQPNILGELSFCEGESTELDAGTFDTYLWSTGEVTPTVTVSTAATYSVTVSDASSCEGVDSVSVVVNVKPEVEIAGSTTFCTGSSTILEGTPGFASYLWADSTTTPTLEVSTPGTYGLTVTDTNGCTGTAEVSVEESEALQPNILGELSFCEGESTELDAGTFDTYLWSTGEVTPTVTVSTAATYSVTVSDASSCEGVDSVSVVVNVKPEVEIAGSTTFCTGSSTILEGTPGFANYLWADSTTTPTLEVSIPGTYGLTVTDTNGCTGTAEVSVEESEALQPNILGELSFCEGESTELDAGTFDTYLWSTGEVTPTVTVSTAATYSVTVSDASSCEGVDSVSVVVNAKPEVEIAGSTTFCTGSSTILEGTPGFASYLWADSTTTPTLEVSIPGTYGLTVTDTNGCTGTAEVSVEESEALQPNILGELSFCEGESTELDAGTFDTYLWSTGEVTPTVTVSTAATYSVTVSDASSCEGVDSVSVVVNVKPEVEIAGSTTFCTGSSTILEGTPGFANYLWADSTTTPTLEVSTPGTYGLTVTNEEGCGGEASVTVSSIRVPTAVNDLFLIGPDDERSAVYDLVNNDDLQFSGRWELEVLSGPGLGNIDGQADGLLSYRASALIAGEATIVYELCSTACPELCSQATVTILVESAIANEDIPNGITPNGDGANDTFFFDILEDNPAGDFPDNRLIIFNRWGDIVYDRRNYDNSWDGRSNKGEKLPDGTYYYILYLDIGGELILKGDVTVLR